MFKLVIFVVLTGSTCGTCSEWVSACLLRYLFHLKFFLMNHAIREKERERERTKKENERKRKRERGRGRRRGRGRERERGGGRGKERGRIRERERERNREKERERERTGCFCKRFFFLLLAPGSALEKFAALVNPENKPTKLNWTLSWPSALEICGKQFFNKGVISGLILLGQGEKQDFFQEKCSDFFTQTLFGAIGVLAHLGGAV